MAPGLYTRMLASGKACRQRLLPQREACQDCGKTYDELLQEQVLC